MDSNVGGHFGPLLKFSGWDAIEIQGKAAQDVGVFIDGNKDKLARDMSTGSGEALESLAKLIGVKDQDKTAFFRATKENFARIFASDHPTTDQVVASLKQVLSADGQLAQYAQAI